jgi:hypothetical protein
MIRKLKDCLNLKYYAKNNVKIEMEVDTPFQTISNEIL